MSKEDPWGEDWGSLRDAIAVVSERFTVRGAETKLRDILASGDLPSTLQGMDGTREWLTGWGEEITLQITWYNHSPRKLLHDHDIEIVRGGLELLNPHLIFVWWPVIEKLCGLAQPEPAVQPEPAPAKSKQPKRRRRRKKVQPAPAPVVPVEPDEKSNLGHEIILAIIHHAHPGGYAHVRTSDLERLVHAPGALEAECKKRGVDRKRIMAGRHAIELATGRRERRKKS